MGFMLILLTIGLFMISSSIVVLKVLGDRVDEWEVLGGCSYAFIVFGGIISLIAIMFFLCTGIDKLKAPMKFQSLNNLRGKYARLLQEDYNANNLSNALDFNERQKNCIYKESNFMWSHFGSNGVCADTIAIPTDKFIPRQIIQLDSIK